MLEIEIKKHDENFLKNEFSLKDSQKEHFVKPEADLQKIAELDKQISELKAVKNKRVEKLVTKAIFNKEHEKFIINRNLVRLNNKYNIDVNKLISDN